MLFVSGPGDLRYLISGPAGRSAVGLLVLMAALAGTGRSVAGYAAAGGAVLVLLAAAAFAVTRALLRPLRQAAAPASSRSACAAEARTRTSPSVISAWSITTAVCDPGLYLPTSAPAPTALRLSRSR